MPEDSLRFRRVGGAPMAVVETADDLRALRTLDEALWAATSIPSASLSLDPRILQHLDADGDGRIRVADLRSAIDWADRVLADHRGITNRADRVALDAFNAEDPEGAALQSAARHVLQSLGDEGDELTRDQLANRRAILASAADNGDGIVPPEAAPDESLAAFIRDLVQCVGGRPDAGGSTGAGEAELDRFLVEARAWLAWRERKAALLGAETPLRMVWGERAEEAFAACRALAPKVEEYFLLRALARTDPAAVAETMARTGGLVRSRDGTDSAALHEALRQAPLADPRAEEEALPLEAGLNPAWASEMAAFQEMVLQPANVEAKDGLAPGDWAHVEELFAPLAEIEAARPPDRVAALGEERLRAILESDLAERLRTMIRKDAAAADEIGRLDALETLLLLQGGLLDIAGAFASLASLYTPEKRSPVETGTLVMGGRRFSLCVRVADRAAHQRLAQLSRICLLYLRIDPSDGLPSYEVAAAVTAGDTTGLVPGRRGLFLPTGGGSADAEIVEILRNPVSLGESLLQPLRHLGSFIERQTERFSAGQVERLEGAITASGPASEAVQPRARSVRDLLLGGGVAAAGLGGLYALVVKAVTGAGPYVALAVLAGLALLVLAPTALAGCLKLRRRNVGGLLSACGWAMNARLRLSRAQCRFFTQTPAPPAGGRGPAAPTPGRGGGRETSWGLVAILLALLLAAVFLLFQPAILNWWGGGEAPARAPAAPTE